MRITLRVMGKSRADWLRAGIGEYEAKLSHYVEFRLEEVTAPRNAASLPRKVLLEREGEALLAAVGEARLILLDAGGRKPDSEGFAAWIAQQQNAGVRELCFLVGGAYGFSHAVRTAAAETISLSPLTFNHQLVRLVALEQLYRAFSILKGEPYHHG